MSDLINSEWDLNYVAKCLVLISNRYWTFVQALFHKSFKSAMVLMISDW